MCAARQSHDEPSTLGDRLAGLFAGRAVRVVSALALLVAVLVGGTLLWRRFQPLVDDDPRYRLAAENIHVTPQPDFIRSDVRGEAVVLGSLDGADVRQDDLTVRVAQAFAIHPWVASVHRVGKRFPPRVDVELEYRTPVAMVEVAGGLLPIDGEAVLLPPADFLQQDVPAYPRVAIGESSPAGPEGTAWGDNRVLGAARIAVLLAPRWKELRLFRIAATSGRGAADLDDTLFELTPRRGTRVIWGRAPGHERRGEAQAATKIARLAELIDQYGPLDSVGAPRQIDLTEIAHVSVQPATVR